MTPKPDTLPRHPRDMTDEQAIAKAIRILRNSGGERYGAGYSWGLAERLEMQKPPARTGGLGDRMPRYSGVNRLWQQSDAATCAITADG